MKYLGLATIRFDGTVVVTKKGASLDLGGVDRKTVQTGREIGYSEEVAPAMVECRTSLREGMSLDALRQISGAEITFECDTGQIYVIRNGWFSETVSVDDSEGEVACKFAGPPAEEVL